MPQACALLRTAPWLWRRLGCDGGLQTESFSGSRAALRGLCLLPEYVELLGVRGDQLVCFGDGREKEERRSPFSRCKVAGLSE